jgi:RHS repeat-associated protein
MLSPHLVAAIAVLVALAVPTALAAGGGPRPRHSDRDPYDLAKDPAAQHAIREQQKAEEKRRDFRGSAEGKQARAESRGAFRHSTKREALNLAKDEFAEAIDPAPMHGLQLPDGQRLVRYLGESGAVVEHESSDQRAVVQATFPLRADTGDGTLQPTDLRLEEQPGGFETANAPVTVEVAKDLSGGVTLPGSLALRPVQPAPTASGELVAGKAFFADSAADTDLWVTPQPAGAEIFTQIRSPEAPDVQAYDVGMPAGARLRLADTRSGAAEIVDGDKIVATISPPVAYDADGEPVPMSYAVQGDRLLVRVAHRDGDYRYPILADPEITVDRFWAYGADSTGWATQINGGGAWGFDLNSGEPFGRPYWGRGLWIWDWPGGQYTAYWSGEWLFRWNRGNSYITQLQFGGADFDPRLSLGQSFTCQTFGIWSETTSVWEGNTGFNCTQHTGWDGQINAGPNFNYGTPSNHATMLLWTTGSGSGGTQTVSQVDWTRVWLSDRDSPTVSAPTHSIPPSTWGDNGTRTVTLSAGDPGLGMKHLDFKVPATAAWQRQSDGCGGGYETPCPAPLSKTFTYSLDSLAEGNGAATGSARALDVLEHETAFASWNLKIDHSAPRIDPLTGALSANNAWVTEGNKDLRAISHDDYSGVQKSQISISPSILARDAFARTTTAGWGTADVGGAWTVVSGAAADYSTNGSRAQVTLAQSSDHVMSPRSVSSLGQDAAVDVAFPDALQASGLTTASVLLRRNNSTGAGYRVALMRDSAGNLWIRSQNVAGASVYPDVDTSLNFEAGSLYRLRVRVTGANPTTLKAKVWRVGSPEPFWTLSATDSTAGPQVAGEVAVGAWHGTPGVSTIGIDNFAFSDVGSQVRDTKQNTKAGGAPAPCDAASGCTVDLDHQFTWNTTEELEGPHTIAVRANDPLNHAPADKTVTVNVDTKAPVVTSGPAGSLWDNRGKFIRKGVYDLSATVTDSTDGSGVSEVKVLVDSVEEDASHAQQSCSTSCPASMTRNFTFDTTGRTEGPWHRVQMIARDKAGHSTTVADFNVKVDNTDPAQGGFNGTLAPPSPATAKKWLSGGSHNLVHSPTDAGSGVMRDYMGVSRRVVTDAFGRTPAAGWGSADRGGLYTIGRTAGGTVTVAGGEGVMTMPQNGEESQILGTVSARDVDERVTVRFPGVTLNGAATENIAAGLVGRRTACAGALDGCQYRVMVVVAGNGKVLLRGLNEGTSTPAVWPDVDTGLVFSPSDSYVLRLRVLGTGPTTMQAKVWKAGTAEPAGWMVERTGSQFTGPLPEGAGNFGLKATSKLAGSNAARFDDFSVDELVPLNAYRPSCDATAGCPTAAPTQTLWWNTAGYDEGLHRVLVWTSDAVEQTVVKSWDVYLDSVGPALSGTPTGTLWDNRGKYMREGSYDLHVTAADQPGMSGVKDIRVFVNGVEEDAANAAQACGDDCPQTMTRHYTFNTAGRTDSEYAIVVIARDKAGTNTTLIQFNVRVDTVYPSQGTFGGDLAPPAAGAPKKWLRGGSHSLTHTPSDSYSGVLRDWATVGKTVAIDTFSRTSAAGWHFADKGGGWKQGGSTGGTSQIDGSQGIITQQQNTSHFGYIDGSSPRDIDARVKVRVPAAALDGTANDAVTAGFVARRTECAGGPIEQCHLRVLLLVKNNGKIFLRGGGSAGFASLWSDVDTGLTFSTADTYNLRVRVVGVNPLTVIQAKVWKEGVAEPSQWTVSKTSADLGAPVEQAPGRVGLRTSSAVPGSITIRFDDFSVEDLTPASTFAPSCSASWSTPCPANPGQQTTTWNADSEDDGAHQVFAVTADAVEHTRVVAWKLYLDRTKPTTSNRTGSLAEDGGTITLGTQTLGIDTADATSGVKKVELLINGNPYADVDGTCTPDECSTSKHADFTWDSSDSSGQQTLTVRVTDHAGNVFDDSWTVVVDGTPPTLTLSGGLLPPVATGRNLHMESDDADSGVAKFEVWLDPDADPAPDHTFEVDCFTGCPHHAEDDYALPVDTPPGTHTIRVRVSDAAGYTRERQFDVTVVDLLPASRSKLGLEHWFQYHDVDAGGGSKVFVNAETGNAVWHSVPIVNPGRGLSTVVNLTYNSQDRGGILGSTLGRVPVVDVRSTGLSQDLPGLSYGQAGVGFSIGVSGPTRLNEPLGGVILAQAREESIDLPEYGVLGSDDGLVVTLTDADGTVHTFTRSGDKWIAPPGLNMNLRRYKPGGTPLAPIDDKWAMTRPDGVTHFFDNLGYQTSTQDRNGNTLRYCYEVYNAITGTTPSHGAENDCDHPPTVTECVNVDLGSRRFVEGVPVVCGKRVWRVLDPGGRELNVFYRDRPFVTEDYADPASDPDATLRHAWYRAAQLVGGSAGEIDRIVDHAGRTYRFAYDDEGYLTDLTEAAGTPVERVTHLNYEGWQPGLQQVGQDRQLTEVVPMEGGEPLPKTAIRYVHPDDRRAIVPAPGIAMRAREVCGVTPRNDSQTDSVPVSVSGQDCRTRANDRETTYSYGHDSSGQTTSFDVTEILNRAVENGSAQSATTETQIDELGRPTRVTDPLGTRTELTWDDDLNAITDLERGLGPDGSQDEATKTSLEYDKTHGTGVVKKETEYPDWPSTGNARATDFGYQFSNGVHHSTAPGVVDAGGTFVTDLTEIQSPRAGTGASFQIEQIGADYNGNVTFRWNRPGRQGTAANTAYGPGGVITSETDERSKTTHYSDFDDGGQPQTVTDPRGKTWHYKYDAVENVAAVVDPRGANPTFDPDGAYTTTLTYDALDRLRIEKVPKQSADGGANERFTTRSRTFDRDGNVKTATDGNGTTMTVDHGPMGEPRRVEVPGDAGTEVTKYAYDAANRLIARVDPLGPDGTPGVGDQVGACTGAALPGVVSHMTRFCLDDVGRRVAEVHTSSRSGDPARLITSFAFDRRGNVVGITDPKRNSGRTVAEAVAAAGTESGARTTFTYNKTDERTDEVEHPLASDADPTALHTHFDYDANGNRTQALPPRAYEGGGAPDTSFATKWFYDLKDQRVAVRTPSGCTAYAYEENGLRKSVTSPRGTEGAPDDCAQGGPFTHFTTSYTYDDAGKVRTRSIPYAPDQYGRDDAEFAAWHVTYDRDDVGNPVLITDPRGHQFLNSFYDSGALRSTGRPEFFALDWGGGDHANPDPGLHYGEAESGADFELADGGPVLREVPGRPRNVGGAGQGTDLPNAKEQGKFATVDPLDIGGMLPDAGTTEFEYDDEMRLTAVVDAAGKRREIGYDPQGRVVRKQWPFDGARVTQHIYEYDLGGNLKRYFDGRLQLTTFGYDGYDRRFEETTPGSRTDPDDETSNRQVTSYGYDLNGNLKTRTTARDDLAFHFDYDSLDRLVDERDPTGAQWNYGYDLNGNRTCGESPLGGDDECDPDSGFATTREYDESDRLRKTTDGDGNATDFEYDADGNRTQVLAPGSESHEGGEVLRRRTDIDYDGRGLPWRTSTSGPDGQDRRTTINEYDPNGNLRRTVNPSGTHPGGLPKVADATATGNDPEADLARATWHATVRDYDADDQLTAVRFPWSKKAADPDDGVDDPQDPSDAEAYGDERHLVQRFRRDGGASNPLSRVRSIVSPHETEDDNAPRISYTYFDNGWPKSQSEEKVMDANTSTPVKEREVTFDYDQEGNQTLWVTENFPERATGRRVQRTFNDDGTLLKRVAVKPHPGGNGETRRTYRYGYNANRSLTGIFDYGDVEVPENGEEPAPGAPRATNILRDDAEREHVVNEAWGGGRDTLFEYDDNGNVRLRRVDGAYSSSAGVEDYSGDDAKSTTFTYDSLDHERTMTVDPPRGDNRTTTTTWWPSGDMHARTKDNDTVETRYFDVHGRISRKTRNPDEGDTETQDYDYDADGNRTKDERGTERFDPRGQLAQWKRGSKYDEDNAGKDKVGTTVEYTRNDNGDVLTKKDSFKPNPQVTGDTTMEFTYSGERLLKTHSTTPTSLGAQHARADYSYDDFGSVIKIVTQISGPGDPPPSDPPAGPPAGPECEEVPSAVEEHVSRYCFDEFERLVFSRGEGIEKPVKYVYDGLDRRDRSTTDPEGAAPKHLDHAYVGTSKLLSRETTSDGDVKTYDYDSQGHRLGQDRKPHGEPASDPPKVKTYATDANGSVEGLEDDHGKFASDPQGRKDTYVYDPYGESEKFTADVSEKEDPGLSRDAKENPFRFEGFYFDSGVKSYDMQAREYRPDVGRFLSVDRYESAAAELMLQADPLTQNRYAFAGGNPVNRVEFDGHDPHANVTACEAQHGSNCGARGAEISRQQSAAARRGPPPPPPPSREGCLGEVPCGGSASHITIAPTLEGASPPSGGGGGGGGGIDLGGLFRPSITMPGQNEFSVKLAEEARDKIGDGLSVAGDGFNAAGDVVDSLTSCDAAPSFLRGNCIPGVNDKSAASWALHGIGDDLKSRNPVRIGALFGGGLLGRSGVGLLGRVFPKAAGRGGSAAPGARGPIAAIGPAGNPGALATHDHHIFPQQFRGFFESRGVDIDAYTVQLGQRRHLAGVHGRGADGLPGQWNARWREFITNNPGATDLQVYQHAGRLMDEYQLGGLPIRRYGGH